MAILELLFYGIMSEGVFAVGFVHDAVVFQIKVEG